MQMSLSKELLCEYLVKQLNILFLEKNSVNKFIIKENIDESLERNEFCFKHIKLPGYRNSSNELVFSHLHMDQYGTFIYFISNSIWQKSYDKGVCDKLLNLQKALNGFFYHINALCQVFLFKASGRQCYR